MAFISHEKAWDAEMDRLDPGWRARLRAAEEAVRVPDIQRELTAIANAARDGHSRPADKQRRQKLLDQRDRLYNTLVREQKKYEKLQVRARLSLQRRMQKG